MLTLWYQMLQLLNHFNLLNCFRRLTVWFGGRQHRLIHAFCWQSMPRELSLSSSFFTPGTVR